MLNINRTKTLNWYLPNNGSGASKNRCFFLVVYMVWWLRCWTTNKKIHVPSPSSTMEAHWEYEYEFSQSTYLGSGCWKKRGRMEYCLNFLKEILQEDMFPGHTSCILHVQYLEYDVAAFFFIYIIKHKNWSGAQY